MARRGAQGPPQVFTGVAQRAALGAARRMLGERHTGACIEFAIEPGVEHLASAQASHDAARRAAPRKATASRSRPREMRDITVPIGTFTMALISL